ncbi:kinase-like domain-containing protein [Syncephalis fuscata]|nr:kinase-like domain-containing protein [Syncephalis fuscata]
MDSIITPNSSSAGNGLNELNSGSYPKTESGPATKRKTDNNKIKSTDTNPHNNSPEFDAFMLELQSIPAARLAGDHIDAGPYSLILGRFLGRGAYGEVYRAQCLKTNQKFAVKAMKASVLTPGVRRQVEREVDLQRRCAGHPGVLKAYGLIIVPDLPIYRTNTPQKSVNSLSPPISPYQPAAQSISSSLFTNSSNLFPTYTSTSASAPSGWYILLEYCEGGDLFGYITRSTIDSKNDKENLQQDFAEDIISDTTSKKIFISVLKAVQWCHLQGVAHRDLKPENILLKRRRQLSAPTKKAVTSRSFDLKRKPNANHWNGDSDDELDQTFNIDDWDVKLADFGLATDYEFSSEFGCGSVFYMSPECHPNSSRQPYITQSCDVWSTGILLINLLRQVNPWRRAHVCDAGYRYYVARPRKGLRQLTGIQLSVNDILVRALHPDPACRCTIDELIMLTQDTWIPQLVPYDSFSQSDTKKQQSNFSSASVKQATNDHRAINGKNTGQFYQTELKQSSYKHPNSAGHNIPAVENTSLLTSDTEVNNTSKKCVTALAGTGKTRDRYVDTSVNKQNVFQYTSSAQVPAPQTTFHNPHCGQTMQLEQVCRLSDISEISHESSSNFAVTQALPYSRPYAPESLVPSKIPTHVIMDGQNFIDTQGPLASLPSKNTPYRNICSDRIPIEYKSFNASKVAPRKSKLPFFKHGAVNDISMETEKSMITCRTMAMAPLINRKASNNASLASRFLSPVTMLRRVFGNQKRSNSIKETAQNEISLKYIG